MAKTKSTRKEIDLVSLYRCHELKIIISDPTTSKPVGIAPPRNNPGKNITKPIKNFSL